MRVEVPSPTSAFGSSVGRSRSNGMSGPSLRKGARSRSGNDANGTNGKSRTTQQPRQQQHQQQRQQQQQQQQQPTSNGSSSPPHPNGSTLSSSPYALASDYFGHDREEVTRILIQSLDDLGYHAAATTLSRESGYEVESAAIAAFRSAVLHGDWAGAETLLSGLPMSTDDAAPLGPDEHEDPDEDNREQEHEHDTDHDQDQDQDHNHDRHRHRHRDHDHDLQRVDILLADGADKKEMLFAIRQQKYLELLEDRNLSKALMVLRQELTPLHKDISRLHALSSMMMCQSAEDLKAQANWDGAAGRSRRNLLSDLSASISPSVMIPERRLAILLHKVKQNQIISCLYHNTTVPPSLYFDHACDRSHFPLESALRLDEQADEVWYLQFSNDGSRLATAARDGRVIIYDVPFFNIRQTLDHGGEGVIHIAWSPDDKKLLSSTHNHTARVWDVEIGVCLATVEQHTEPVTACAWSPDGNSFVTGSLDRQMPMGLWNLNGSRIHAWAGNFRVQHCCVTADGRRLVAISMDKKIHVYDFRTREIEYTIPTMEELTCLTVSRDCQHMLVNVGKEIQLIDMDTADVVRRFCGQKQTKYVVRSSFGGAGENFVVSGSEDSYILIWHRENGTLVEKLEAHPGGCVNGIAWNPVNPTMFASCGDDTRVLIWSAASEPPLRRYSSSTDSDQS